MKTCKIANCPNPPTRKSLCNKHYMREYRRTHPQTKDNLIPFLNDFPRLMTDLGLRGYTAILKDGIVTLKRIGSPVSATWKLPE